MRKWFLLTAAALVMCFAGGLSLSVAYEESVKQQADRHWIDKSYQMAAPLYEAALKSNDIPEKTAREIRVKLADCLWRAGGEARAKQAEKLLKEQAASEEHDRWWAEANESLAGYYLQKDRWSHAEEIKAALVNAREFWAGETDIKLARPRFIQASFTLGDFITQNWGWYYTGIRRTRLSGAGEPPAAPGEQGLNVLYEEVLKVAETDADKAKAHYSLAMSCLNRGYGEEEKKKVRESFEKIIEEFPDSEWADDAYYNLGQFYERANDFNQAIAAYRGLLTRFRRGDSSWVDDAQRRVKDITEPRMNLGISYTFLPDSQVQFNLGWRNVSEAIFTLYKLDLPRLLQMDPSRSLTDGSRGVDNYAEMIRRLVTSKQYVLLPKERAWRRPMKDEGKHLWYSESKGLAEWLQPDDAKNIDPASGVLAPGAYLLFVSAGQASAYDLILVTDMGLVTKVAGQSALFYTFDSHTGVPRGNVSVTYHYRYYNDQGQWLWEEGAGTTDGQGLLRVPLKTSAMRNYGNQHNLFACVSDGQMQAFAQGYFYAQSRGRGDWWLYAYSDRPAYRPGEEISWKGTLRRYDGAEFTNPDGMPVKVRLYDAWGNTVKEGAYRLNAYGSFADTLVLDGNAVLGEYYLRVMAPNNDQILAQAALFRLEEYKLPEFVVSVKPKPKEDKSGPVAYRLGDEVEVDIEAQYYFGGPVPQAEVEYLIYASPYYHFYQCPRPYPWYYGDTRPYYQDYGPGTLVKKETVSTDEQGKASFVFQSPKDSPHDLKYRVDVRVVDQSRREVSSVADIKVTRNSFFAYLTPKHNLYRPGDKAEVNIKVLTANDEPLIVDGKVSVLKNWWQEPVLEKGQAVRGGDYSKNELFTRFVKTDEKGEAVVDFEPQEDGYYTLEFTGYDRDGSEVKSWANVFVCGKESRDIGYRYGGLQIISEKDTYAAGEVAKLMIVAERPDTWVLLTGETEEIHQYHMLHLPGPVQLVEIPVEDYFTPNIFFNALSGDQYQVKMASLEVVVPPEKKFLNVRITADKETYAPREEGTFDIKVTDAQGRPVMAEIALGLVDKSVFYIQNDYAGDIREFFYGEKRPLTVQTQTSFNQRRYQKLLKDQDGRIITEEEHARRGLMKGSEIREEAELYVTDEVTASGEAVFMEKNALADASLDMEGSGRGGRMVLGKMRATMPAMASMEQKSKEMDKVPGMDSGGALAEPEVRTDFRSTVFWQPAIETDENGRAVVSTRFPDSLTTWQSTARAVTPGTQVGNISLDVKTKKNIIVRLQAPRFFTERDAVTLSANVHNYTDTEQKIKVSINAAGLDVLDDTETWVTVPSQGEQRVDWSCQASHPGQAEVTVMAQATDEADAMKKNYTVIPHGIEKFVARTLSLQKAEDNIRQEEITLEVPAERIRETTSLQLLLSPSMAAAMLDALPYLVQYPYGCVEQTMSRFLPSIIVAKTLSELGLSRQDVDAYLADVMGARGDPQYPHMEKHSSLDQLKDITQTALKRLYEFQHEDGGWGWWKEDKSDRFMSAYVVWGLSLAQQAGVKVEGGVLSRAVDFLRKELVEEENNPDMLAWMLHALAEAQSSSAYELKQSQRLWDMRDQLNPYTRALFALSEYKRGQKDNAQILARNLANGMKEDRENGTAHWGESGIHYRWSEGGVEATAFVIKALATVDPQSPYLQPAVKWLALNRRGARWKNTRDTAIAVLGLADYLKTTSELTPDYDYEIRINGEPLMKGHVDRVNMFTFNRSILVPDDKIKDGMNTVQVAMNGAGALYLAGYLQYFTLEEGITPEGNEVFVDRKYYRQSQQETLLKGYKDEWQPLEPGAAVTSGDRIKVEITLDAKNHYEYLVVEDYKPAGCEATELKSGSGSAVTLGEDGRERGGQVWLYQEFRDQKAAFFITRLPQGRHKIQYELRAEVPGDFHGMPNQVHAMYVPEIRANSSEARIKIMDKGQE